MLLSQTFVELMQISLTYYRACPFSVVGLLSHPEQFGPSSEEVDTVRKRSVYHVSTKRSTFDC